MRLVRRVVRKHAPLLLARCIRCRFLGVADPRIPRELARDFDDLATLTAGPDFRAPDFLACLHTYQRRDRRFGGVPSQTNGSLS